MEAMKFATPSEALDAGLAVLGPVKAILAQIEDCERRLGEVQQQLGSARAEHKSLTATIEAQLAQRDGLHRDNEALTKEIEANRQSHLQQLARAQQELEMVTHKRDEAQAELNRTVEAMRRMLSARQ
jgi:chromosome segregation ATPase